MKKAASLYYPGSPGRPDAADMTTRRAPRITTPRRLRLWNMFLDPLDRERLYLGALKEQVSQSDFVRVAIRQSARRPCSRTMICSPIG
jgi:hypothetical protein